MIKRSKEAVEKYKEEAEKEQIQLGELEQYASNFSIVGEDEEEGYAKAEEILKGEKAWENGILVYGSMKDYSGETVTASSVTRTETYTQLTIPQNGYYTSGSKVQTLNSNIDLNYKSKINKIEIESWAWIDVGKTYTI